MNTKSLIFLLTLSLSSFLVIAETSELPTQAEVNQLLALPRGANPFDNQNFNPEISDAVQDQVNQAKIIQLSYIEFGTKVLNEKIEIDSLKSKYVISGNTVTLINFPSHIHLEPVTLHLNKQGVIYKLTPEFTTPKN